VSKRFDPPTFGDGKLEIIGVGGVAHMVGKRFIVSQNHFAHAFLLFFVWSQKLFQK